MRVVGTNGRIGITSRYQTLPAAWPPRRLTPRDGADKRGVKTEVSAAGAVMGLPAVMAARPRLAGRATARRLRRVLLRREPHIAMATFLQPEHHQVEDRLLRHVHDAIRHRDSHAARMGFVINTSAPSSSSNGVPPRPWSVVPGPSPRVPGPQS